MNRRMQTRRRPKSHRGKSLRSKGLRGKGRTLKKQRGGGDTFDRSISKYAVVVNPLQVT